MEGALNPRNLTLAKERTLFVIVLIVSCAVWIACVLTIVPAVGFAVAAVILWFAHGLLIGRIKSEAVKVGPDQMSALSDTFGEVSQRLELRRVPDLYLMQSGGLLNAFATRHSARDFVVLYSDIVEAYGPDSAEIRFLLGHEIGHIRSKHILKNLLLLPGLFLPLLGAAYNRACESSCDRHGAFAADEPEASVRAMMILSGGKRLGRDLLADAFSKQHHAARGFFVSLHELFSPYPTLSKRVSDLLDLQHQRSTPRPGRNPLAYLIGACCPGARFGVLGVAMTFYMIMIFSSIALPLITKARSRAHAAAAKTATELKEQLQEVEPDDLPASDAASPSPRRRP